MATYKDSSIKAKFDAARAKKSGGSSSSSSGGSSSSSSSSGGLQNIKDLNQAQQTALKGMLADNAKSSGGSSGSYSNNTPQLQNWRDLNDAQKQMLSGFLQSKYNPTITSTETRAEYDALGNEINTKLQEYDSSAYLESSREIQKALDRRMKELERMYKTEREDIKSSYESSAQLQAQEQQKEYAGRATNLVTSGGGFLGATQSQQGVLQNLSNTHEQEKQALMAKRDSALQEASNAFAENRFNLAQLKLKEAKDTEQEIYNRTQDYNDRLLQMAQEKRAQTQFELGITDKKAASYANLPDKEYSNISDYEKEQIDKMYYPGYLDNLQEVTSKSAEIQDRKDWLAIEKMIFDIRNSMPDGKKFTFGGVTYTGLKVPDSTKFTQTEMEINEKQKIKSWFTSGTVIPGTKDITFLDNDGYLTPEGWQTAYEYSTMDRRDFIEEFGWLLKPDELPEGITYSDKILPKYTNYGLKPSEEKILNEQSREYIRISG
jgi:hypothetical protein